MPDAGDRAPPQSKRVAENAAWASAEIPVPPADVFAFLLNVERLVRLNPCLEVAHWRVDAADRHVSALNESNGCRWETRVTIEALHDERGLTLIYASGLKQATEFTLAASGRGTLLTVTEHYHPVDGPDDPRVHEVDCSLVPWLAAIRRHLRGLARWGKLPGYRWWTQHILLGMPPRQRRIIRLIVWVSVIEFVVFLFVAAIFWLERRAG